MKSRLFYILFSVVLGTVAFWLPTVMMGGSSFILPALFAPGPWLLLAIPYLAIFVVIFLMVAAIYRLLKRKFAISIGNGAWILLGLYLSLAFFFFFAAHLMAKGTFAL